MEKILRSIYFESLKGLKDFELKFTKPLTAIMGINGSGKTTILHALACVYRPERNGQNNKFSNFFIPNPHSVWEGSKLRIRYRQGEITKSGMKRIRTREYYKRTSRWAPDYSTRPIRDTFYLGIDSCLPEIEKQKKYTYFHYTTEELDDRISKKIIEKASYILNKDYFILTKHETGKRSLIGVRTTTGLIYSSLSMGTGEQRVIKILDTIFNAPNYSMVLIDEIDLLLHVNALKKLLIVLNKEAIRKNLQIIFTTHSLLMNEINEVDIRYIEITPTKTLVYDSINTGMIYSITGNQKKPIKIFVEDTLSQSIIRHIAKEQNIMTKIHIGLFGAAHNAFTLAASFILRGEDSENVLIVIDGDEYRNDEDKMSQIKKTLTGTEADIESRQNDAFSLISQFELPDIIKPEKFIHEILISPYNDACEIVNIAREIRAVDDNHSYIYDIVTRIGDSYDVVMKDIMNIVAQSEKWDRYTHKIRCWLTTRVDL
ncbi:MAG: AAA family ATPase [Desulfosporosinus sp.]|nr:AAA family ATPase [Desulfosporosinus sp.]